MATNIGNIGQHKKSPMSNKPTVKKSVSKSPKKGSIWNIKK